MLTQVTIHTDTIKQADNRTKGGRPRKDSPHAKRFRRQGFNISDEAMAAITAAAAQLGVTQSALVEALGRTLAAERIAA